MSIVVTKLSHIIISTDMELCNLSWRFIGGIPFFLFLYHYNLFHCQLTTPSLQKYSFNNSLTFLATVVEFCHVDGTVNGRKDSVGEDSRHIPGTKLPFSFPASAKPGGQ